DRQRQGEPGRRDLPWGWVHGSSNDHQSAEWQLQRHEPEPGCRPVLSMRLGTDGGGPVMRALGLRRRTGSRRGQALVEFALVLPIFILLLVGIFDFGRAIYAYNTISNAAREAVRVGVVDQSCNV